MADISDNPLQRELAAQAAEIERLKAELEIRARKLRAQADVIAAAAARELERKAVLGGAPDLLWQRYRPHPAPVYGDLAPATEPAAGRHVAVDTLEIVFGGVSGGVETYMKMLVSALLSAGERVTLLCLPEQLEALRAQFGGRVGYFSMRASRAQHWALRGRRLGAAKSFATFSRLREDLGVDVLHSPVQIFSVLDFRVPSVLNLHDLQHLHFPENFRPSDIEARNYLYGLSTALADAVLVSSEFVRRDLIEKMSVPAAKVFSVPVTWNPMVERGLASFSADDARRHYRLPANYALYPAQFWPHKNHARLVEALAIVRSRRPAADLKLVLTGYRGHSGWPAVEKVIGERALQDHVLCLDYVPTEHLAGLYKASAFCVMPSTFEASSYPVIEAQVLGVPAMCSDVTSLPELMRGGCGLLFDPRDPADIAAKMLRWIDDPADAAAHAARAVTKARAEHSLANYVAGLGRVYQYVQASA